MQIKCPNNPIHKTFITKQKVSQEIQLDEEGNYVSTYNDQDVISTDYDNITCSECGSQAEVL